MYRRKYKVELTLDVPLSRAYKMTEGGIAEMVESYLDTLNPQIFSVDKEPLEDIHKDYAGNAVTPEEDDEDITRFPEAVGFIAPDGKFYGGNVSYDPLMHVLYAREVWEAYKNKIDADTVHIYGQSNFGIDFDLERWGFIKVRQSEIRYYVPFDKNIPAIPWTPAQCATVLRYIEMMELLEKPDVKFVSPSGHGTAISAKKFTKMTDADIIQCFRI